MTKFGMSFPVKPYMVNQVFGNDPTTYGQFGLKGHNGVDLFAYHGQPIYATHDGIAFFERDNSQGEGVVIISDKPYDYNGKLAFFKTIYWHMCDASKEPKFASPISIACGGANTGKSVAVKEGDLIGYADNTGFSSGDHLHFGLKPIIAGNEPTYGDAPDVNIGAWVNVEQNNGYLGAIDPVPYFDGFYAQDSKIVVPLLLKLLEFLQIELDGILKKKQNG